MTNRIKPLRLFRRLRAGGDGNPGNYENIQPAPRTSLIEEAQVITSETRDDPFFHHPVIDIDVPCYVIPTNGAHKYTLFIDAAVPKDQYFALLDAMAEAGIVEPGYAYASRQRGYSAARLPWVNKEETEPAETEGPGMFDEFFAQADAANQDPNVGPTAVVTGPAMGTCAPRPIGCGLTVYGFRDDLSRREFGISGLCQACQDNVFGGD